MAVSDGAGGSVPNNRLSDDTPSAGLTAALSS